MAKKRDYTRREVINSLGAAALGASAVSMPIEVSGQSSSSIRLVTRYRLGWNHLRGNGVILLYLQATRTPIRIEVTSLEQFAGYLAILKETPVYYDARGWVSTGAEEIG